MPRYAGRRGVPGGWGGLAWRGSTAGREPRPGLVDAYLDRRGLWRNDLFARVVQALIELAPADSEERATL